MTSIACLLLYMESNKKDMTIEGDSYGRGMGRGRRRGRGPLGRGRG
jgi:hypothetical protein